MPDLRCQLMALSAKSLGPEHERALSDWQEFPYIRSALAWQWPRLAILVDRHIGQRRFGHLHDVSPAFEPALRIDLDVDGNGGAADLHHVRIETHQVADKHRLLEQE